MTNATGRKNVLSGDARRDLVLRGLSGEPRAYLAELFGVSLSRVEKLLAEARKTTETDANEASKELEFRRRVLGMLR